MSATLDRLLAGTRADIDKLRAESADHARDASAIADQMAEPTDVLHAMEAEERDLVLKLEALRGAMKTARNALDAMADERDLHTRRADAAADAAEYYERTTLPHLAALLDGIPPAEALAATGLMVDGPKDIEPNEHTCANMGCTSCIGCDGCTCHDPAHSCLPWDESTRAECTGCHPVDDIAGDGTRMNDDHPPAVRRAEEEAARAAREPVATPPVPTAPAGELVATHRPDRTLPDGHALPPLPPGTGHHSHAKPGLGSRITGGFKALLDKPEPVGEQQGDGDA